MVKICNAHRLGVPYEYIVHNLGCMKPLFYLLLVVITLCSSQRTFAGFILKRPVATESKNITAGNATYNEAAKHPNVLPIAYNPYKKNDWYGVAAIISGLLGLFIPGVNFLAILFGVLGMGRGCKAQGLAIAGFVIGVLEMVVFLLASSTVLALILF